jgi:hypothetical protein
MSKLDINYLVQSAARKETDNVNTCIPAKIMKYDEVTQLATVGLCVRRPSIDNDYGDVLLGNVPIVFPSGLDWVIAAPLQIGDGVLVHFCMYDIGNYLESFEKDVVVEAATLLQHDFSSVYAIPGTFTYHTPTVDLRFTDRLHITKDDEYITMDAVTGVDIHTVTSVHIDAIGIGGSEGASLDIDETGVITATTGGTSVSINADGTVYVSAPTSVTIDSPATTITGTLEVLGIVTAPDLVLPAALINTHTHTGDSGGNTGPPQ